jgi:hypothetical protein
LNHGTGDGRVVGRGGGPAAKQHLTRCKAGGDKAGARIGDGIRAGAAVDKGAGIALERGSHDGLQAQHFVS